MTACLRDLCRGLEAIINGMFGILLCVMIGLLPLRSLERPIPWMPAGYERVIILLLACLALEGVNIWRILTAHLDPESSPDPSAALRYQPSSNLILRLLSFLWHLFYMLCAIAIIVMCEHQALHGATTRDKVEGADLRVRNFGSVQCFSGSDRQSNNTRSLFCCTTLAKSISE